MYILIQDESVAFWETYLTLSTLHHLCDLNWSLTIICSVGAEYDTCIYSPWGNDKGVSTCKDITRRRVESTILSKLHP